MLGNKTTKEMFTGEELEVSHLRIFGCPVYVHFPKDKRSKLDPSARRAYLLDTMNHRRHIESTFLVIGRLRLAEMSLSMRIKPSVDESIIIYMRSMMRSLKLLE